MVQKNGTWDEFGLYIFASVISLSLKVPLRKMYLPWSSMRVSEIWMGTFLEKSIETPLDLGIGEVA